MDGKLLTVLRGGCVATVLLGVPPAPAAAPPSGSGEGPPAGPSLSARVRADLRNLGTHETVLIVAAGGVAAGFGSVLRHGRDEPGLPARASDAALWDVTDAYGDGLFLGGGTLAVLGAGALSGSPALSGLGWDLAASLTATQILVGALKVTTGRTRPDGGRWSFPSGHSAGAFCVAPVLAEHVGWKTGAAAGVAAIGVAAGRIQHRRHYLSDVLFGAGIGIAVGRAVAHDPDRAPRVSLRPEGASLAFVACF